jgi:Sec-independent protein translocase protein TatA
MGEVGKGITAFKRGVKDSTEEIENASARTTADGTDARDVTRRRPRANATTRNPAPDLPDRACRGTSLKGGRHA